MTFTIIAQEDILLKDYDPVSIYKIPKTTVGKAKYPVIDIHSYPYAITVAAIDKWVKTMDKFGIEKTTILTKQTGKVFDSILICIQNTQIVLNYDVESILQDMKKKNAQEIRTNFY